MVQRLRIFLVVLLLMFTANFYGQNIPQKIQSGILLHDIFSKSKSVQSINRPPNLADEILLSNISSTIISNSKYSPQIFLYTSSCNDLSILNWGEICRIEYKFEKVTGIPLKVRIGSLDYTNYFEKKPNALRSWSCWTP
jgi:hypothetical protein